VAGLWLEHSTGTSEAIAIFSVEIGEDAPKWAAQITNFDCRNEAFHYVVNLSDRRVVAKSYNRG
jgi:hypothetical protein